MVFVHARYMWWLVSIYPFQEFATRKHKQKMGIFVDVFNVSLSFWLPFPNSSSELEQSFQNRIEFLLNNLYQQNRLKFIRQKIPDAKNDDDPPHPPEDNSNPLTPINFSTKLIILSSHIAACSSLSPPHSTPANVPPVCRFLFPQVQFSGNEKRNVAA